MSKTLVNILLSILLLVPVQAIIFNNLILFNVAVPLVFIYVIISLPVTLGTNISLTLAFITGLAVDIFGDTQGVNALACTLLAFARKPVYELRRRPGRHASVAAYHGLCAIHEISAYDDTALLLYGIRDRGIPVSQLQSDAAADSMQHHIYIRNYIRYRQPVDTTTPT